MNLDASDHVGLARWIAGKLRAPDHGSVTGAALLAVVKATERYDETRGPFAAFAGLLAKRAAWSEVQRQRRTAARETSLFVTGADGEEVERRDLPREEPDVEARLLVASLREALATLPERERRVLELHFGLTGDARTLTEVGLAVGLSRPRVWQLERRAIERLRQALTERPDRAREEKEGLD